MPPEISPSPSPEPLDRVLHIGVSGPLLSSYRHLALAVIERALRDTITHGCSSTERVSAHAFLGGSPTMRHWCRVAGLDPRRVVAVARQVARAPVDRDRAIRSLHVADRSGRCSEM